MDHISEILALYNCVNLEDRIQYDLDTVVEKEMKQSYHIENLKFCISCMDYTTLKLADTEGTVKKFISDLLKKLKRFNLKDVAAVCVFPPFVAIVREMLKTTEIQTTVVAGNFPTAQTFSEVKLMECKLAIAAGAQEIDTVISVGEMLEKNVEKVYQELLAIRRICSGVKLKVILEVGELKSVETIFQAALIAAYAGADFIKTSTGKVPVNATPESVYVICEAIKQYYVKTGRRVGLKVAGGISKAQSAINYLNIVNHVLGQEWLTPEYFRIGASQLMDDLIKEVQAMEIEK